MRRPIDSTMATPIQDIAPSSSSPQSQTHSRSHSRRPATATLTTKRSRRHSSPFVFPHPFQSNVSSTSLIPSTAEGRPIPLDDSTTADRTTALRQLNRSQPVSRHRYAKSSGAPATTGTTTGTYSQPVIVRTYSGLPPSTSSRRPASRRVPLSNASAASSNTSHWRMGRNGVVISMARSVGKKSAQPAAAEAKLPPMEAFSFKSIIADVQQDIGADLDRIAEICARSRYSLSNQYEVHVAPHGSGAGFLASSSAEPNSQASAGPTLQAITSDDERNSSSTAYKKRRSGAARRRSAAYGTLETIMSSSRSSDEDKSKKKSAAEIAEEVRGRAARKAAIAGRAGQENSGSSSPELPGEVQAGDEQASGMRRKSISFATAMMDNTRTQQGQAESSASPRSSGTALVSEPAEPKTSRSHLQIRTGPEEPLYDDEYTHDPPPQPSEAVVSDSMASAAIANPEEPRSQAGLLAGLSSWMPWRGTPIATAEIASSDSKGGRSRGQEDGKKEEESPGNESHQFGTGCRAVRRSHNLQQSCRPRWR